MHTPSLKETIVLLEAAELEGNVSPESYCLLLAYYLLDSDLKFAQLLWKRVPDSAKATLPELAATWAVGQKLWVRDYPGVYTAIRERDWSEQLKPIMDKLYVDTQQKVLSLVAKAYSWIRVDHFAQLLHIATTEQAVEEATKLGWEYDPHARLLKPRQSLQSSSSAMPCEQQLARLTEYITFLEN